MTYPSLRTERLRQLLTLVLSCVCLSSAAWPEPLTLEAALVQAQSANPRLQASLAEPRVAAAALKQAQAGPNPILSLSSSGDSNGLGQAGLSYSQELELGGKRQARIALAEAEQLRAEFQLLDARRRLHGLVKQAFYDLVLAQELETLQREQVTILERQLELTRAAVSGGRLPGVDVTRLESERARYQAALASAGAERLQAGLNLGKLLGGGLPLEVAGSLGQDRPVPALEELLASQCRPDVLQAHAQAQVRERAIALEEARGVSNLTLLGGLGYERIYIPGNRISPQGIINFIDDRALGLRLQLSIPLPVADTNEGNIEKARALAEQATAEEQAVALEARVELSRAYHRWQAAREAYRLLSQTSLPQSERILSVLEQAFRIGARSTLELWLARQSLLDVLLQERRAAWTVEVARAELETTWGGDIP